MPWKEVKPMDQRVQLIKDWTGGNYSKTDLSKRYGVSRKTVYKWLKRYQTDGIDGLSELSRMPKKSPSQTSDEVIKVIVAEKLRNRRRGPKKIRAQLQARYPSISWPAPSTIGNWLKKYGLVKRRKKRLLVPPFTEPFVDCKSPNAVWSADYKGQFYTRDKRVCYPLTISDNYSRFLFKCEGLPGPRYEETRRGFESVFREFGLPDAIRCDNGTPFAGRCVGGLSRLSIWWIQLGIVPERIEKGCPQQNGRHERMHRTLKAEVLHEVAQDLREQQERFDLFRLDYNNYRPHEALSQNTPSTCYHKSKRRYVEHPATPDYDFDYTVRKVRHNGEIKFKGTNYFLTDLLYGQYVGLKEIETGFWKIYYSFHALAKLDVNKKKIIR